MNITPINSSALKSRENTTFGAKINGISMPLKTAEKINKLKDAVKDVVGNEVHLRKVKIGEKEAVYTKWMRIFESKIDENSRLSVFTDKNKVKEINLNYKFTDKQGKEKVHSFNFCEENESVGNKTSISFFDCDIETLKLDNYTYHDGEKMSKNIGKSIERLLDIIINKLGISK